MHIPEYILLILDRLEEAGKEAYIVGGAVRDSLLKRSPQDYDLATQALPEEVEEIFKDYRTLDIGKKFGTIGLIIDSQKVEITTYRADGLYIDGRRPEGVEFSTSLREDLERRDFTINALAYNRQGLVDYFQGKRDIEEGVIRAVGDPAKRFKEDHLRILRAVRLASQLGFRIEEETFHYCREEGQKLALVSRDRIREEALKILMSPRPSLGLELMRELGILELVFKDLARTIGFDQNNPHHDKDVYYHTLEVIDRSPQDLVVRLAALFHDLGKPWTYSEDQEGVGHFYGHNKVGQEICHQALRDLNVERKTREAVEKLVYYHMIDNASFSDKGIKRLIRRLGEEDIFRLMELQKADRPDPASQEAILIMEEKIGQILEGQEVYEEKQLAIDGRDVLKLGYKQGKIVGEILDFALDRVMDRPDLNKKDKLLKIIEEEFKGEKING